MGSGLGFNPPSEGTVDGASMPHANSASAGHGCGAVSRDRPDPL